MEFTMKERLDSIFASYEGKRENIIPILQQVQEEFGYLSEESLRAIADFTRVPESQIYAIATFYAQFRFTPVGENHIKVCHGTSCHVKKAMQIQNEIEKRLGICTGEVTPDGQYSLERVYCLGNCFASPCISINDEVIGNMTSQKVADLFDREKKGNS